MNESISHLDDCAIIIILSGLKLWNYREWLTLRSLAT